MKFECQESEVRSLIFTTTENIASNNDGDTTTKEATQRYNEIDTSLKKPRVMLIKNIYRHMFNTEAHNPRKIYREPVAEGRQLRQILPHGTPSATLYHYF